MKVDYFTIPEITISYKDTVKPSERAVVSTTKAAVKIFTEVFKECMEHHEEVYIMLLNRANRLLGISNIAKGGIDGSMIDIRIILQTALKASASSILLCHNHPSGNKKPSMQDLDMTKAIKDACLTVGIRLLDHVIVTAEAYTSFADSGLL